jgi:hypothetical protein
MPEVPEWEVPDVPEVPEVSEVQEVQAPSYQKCWKCRKRWTCMCFRILSFHKSCPRLGLVGIRIRYSLVSGMRQPEDMRVAHTLKPPAAEAYDSGARLSKTHDCWFFSFSNTSVSQLVRLL